MYSLVSAPVLAFDLVRRGGGEQVARLLLTALQLGPDDLPVLAAAHAATPSEEVARAEAWLAVAAADVRSPRVPEILKDVAGQIESDSAAGTRTVRALETAPIGTLDGLLRCLRREVLDWTWAARGDVAVQDDTAGRASAVLCDAVAACYLADELGDDVRRRLAGPWTRALRALERPPLDPALAAPAALVPLLVRLARLTEADRSRLRDAAERSRRSGGSWAEAVHEATWAVHLTDRVRSAAGAQLFAVLALRDGDLPVPDAAGGVWNLVSGAVQALMVDDVVAHEVFQILVRPVAEALELHL